MGKLTEDYKEFLYERLKDPAEAAEYLSAALEDGNPSVFLLALRDLAEVQGIGKVAAAAELNRENLYRILSDQGNPRLSSMLAILQAVGVQIQVKPLKAEGARARKGAIVQPSLFEQTEGIRGLQLVGSGLSEIQESDYGSNNTSSNESAAA
jgi:probable addiction module antidote protein